MKSGELARRGAPPTHLELVAVVAQPHRVAAMVKAALRRSAAQP